MLVEFFSNFNNVSKNFGALKFLAVDLHAAFL